MKEQNFTLSKICRRYAERIAFICKNRRYTFQEFYAGVLQVSAELNRQGIGKGDRVALLSENSEYLTLLIFALFNAGAVAVPVNFRFPPGQIIALLGNLNCRVVFAAGSYYHLLKGSGIPVRSIEDFFKNLQKVKKISTAKGMPLRQTATIIFTSGSSGSPKAVVHTLANHYYNALGANQHMSLRPGDRWLLSLPLFHVGGMAILFRTLLAGAACVISENGKVSVKIIIEQGVTHLSLVATQLFRLLSGPEIKWVSGQLKAILLGGGPVADSLIMQALKKRLPLYLSYGLTEMSSQVATTSRLVYRDKQEINRAGKVLKYRRLKISREGEIWVKGLTLFKGYRRAGRIQRAVDGSGWFHTGDLGRLDRKGRLLVEGRRDTMFISGGENIYPEEIEQHLKNFKGIEDALVIPFKDKEFGQRPAAFIKYNKRYKINSERLRTYLQHKIASYKIPKVFLPWPDSGAKIKPGRSDFITSAHMKIDE